MTKHWVKGISVLILFVFLIACSNDKTSDVAEDNDENSGDETVSEENTNDENSEQTESSDIQEQDVMNIAHRGASGNAPEATTFAFDQAAQTDHAWLEMDIQKTKDDELVVIHDDDIERTTNDEGEVGDFTLEELKELDAGTWFNEANPDKADESYKNAELLTLEEVFERYGKNENYYIETKSPQLNEDMEEPLVDMVEEHDLVDNVIIQSFEPSSLQTVHELNEDIPLIQLLWWEENEETGELEEWLDVTSAPEAMDEEDFAEIREYAVGIAPHLEDYDGNEVIDEAFVQKTLENDLLIHVYTVDTKENMERLIDWGVTGIFTNYTERLDEVLSKK
ncbi:glycerophosphodiester phosphodiesterase [Salibacterium salarium]|uniref:Glycerophosphodiester phosphodiesterase n=1 Tax=Salibacterium salarium TaxID=284579 RepID=A0A428N9U9_9BACI|nr:glycerophosphodiester phosphodiesterase family protein [Salibacterium salarium]RSL35166.1 glycerophosphodiester phosphodiesterase [Salibacterium salarium]